MVAPVVIVGVVVAELVAGSVVMLVVCSGIMVVVCTGVMLVVCSRILLVVCSGILLVVGAGVAEPLTAVPLTTTELLKITYSPRAQSYFREQSCQIVTTLRQGPPGGPAYPFLHTQLVRDVLPFAEVVLAGHVRQ